MASNSSNRSLLTRIGRITVVFCILLICLYTTMLFFLNQWGLTAATHNIILHEADLYMDAYAQKSCTPLPNTQSFKGFLGKESVSQRVKDIFPLEEWDTWPLDSDGIMYLKVVSGDLTSHFHLLINDLPGTSRKFILFYEITVSKETNKKVWHKFWQYSIFGGIAVISLIFLLQFFVARAISPLKSLSVWMNKIDHDHPPEVLPGDINNDEIGQLGHELRSALVRINESTDREKQFLRNASHELRTPISIIRNAMDLLDHKRSLGDTDIDQILARIRRAGDTMKSVTEAILWLAVDRYHAPEKTIVNLGELVREIIDENKEIFKDKIIKLNAHIEENVSLNIEPVLLRIAVDNMLRNAFQYCDDGEITLNCLSSERIEIVNSTPSYEETTGSAEETANMMLRGNFGLGLSLVAKIAEKQGWQFTFELVDDCAVSRLTLPASE